MAEPNDLAADLEKAAAASPSRRIEQRDALAAHGEAIVEPLLEWVRNGQRGHFVIRVFESIGRKNPSVALSALDAVAAADRGLATEVAAARQRLSGTTSSPPTRTGPRIGVLDQVTPFGPPVPSGDCQGITQKGEPCRNPGRYWVGDKLSCSRGHAEYR